MHDMKCRILWIEDETDIVGSVVRPLERDGFNVDIVESVKDARKHMDNLDQYDLVLLDLIIPEKTGEGATLRHPGLSVLASLRATGSKIPVVAYTVVNDRVDAEELARLGVSAVLNKPVTRGRLRATVYAALGISLPTEES